MSNQKFTAAEREAFYQAHAGKCAYTRQSLDMSNFHIDHVLPESLADDQALLADVRSKLDLDEAFSLNGYENLLPAAPSANLQKGALIFDPEFCRYYLAVAAAKKSIVIEELGKIERRRTRGRVLLLLQEALESGKLEGMEVAHLLDRYSDKPEDIFRLQEAIDFADAEYVNEIARADIDSLRDRPVIAVGQLLVLDHLDRKQISVRTCREYDEAIKVGYYPLSTYAIKGASIFEQRSGLLNALERATPAVKSYIDFPRAGVADLNLLPILLFPHLSPDVSEDELAGTYQDKLNQGVIVIDAVRQNFLRVTQPGIMGQQLIEVARADFNGDGIEEILLFEYEWAVGGTFGAGGIRILTRTSEDGLFEEVLLN